MSAISKPIRQLAAVALALAVVGVIFALAVEPAWRHVADARQRIEEQRVLLGRLKAAAARGGEVAELQRLAEQAPLSRLVLKGDTEAIQLAGLQSLVGAAASAQGVRVTSVRPLQAAEHQGVRLVGLKFDVRCDLASLQAIVHRLESSEPTLIVDGLQVRGQGATGAAAGQAGALLDVGLSVYGAQPPRKG